LNLWSDQSSAFLFDVFLRRSGSSHENRDNFIKVHFRFFIYTSFHLKVVCLKRLHISVGFFITI